MKYKVLMTGAGAPGGPGIIKCLLKLDYIDLFIADANDEASGKYILPEKFVKIPKADDPSFCEAILKFCIQNKVDVVFPLVTKELLQFSNHLDAFQKEKVNVIVSEVHSLAIAVDKCRLYEHLSRNNIALPRFMVAKNHQQFLDAVNSLGYPEKPFCIKPGFSNGSRGIRIVDNSIDKFDLIFKYKPNNLYIQFEELDSILKQQQFPELLVSEVLPGDEITIDTILNNGN